MNIAIVGTGIAGLTSAYLLSSRHEVTVFEAAPTIGGHTATVDVDVEGFRYAVDTGFIVYNDWTYPNFIRLMHELGVASRPTDMGFSVKCRRTGFEYNGSSFNGLFAQRRNLLNPRFWNFWRDILRFNKEALADLDSGRIDPSTTLGDYLRSRHYGDYFVQRFLVPMAAAIWSASFAAIEEFPLQFFLRFCKNNGLLSADKRPQWHTIDGGSRTYLAPLTKPFASRIHTDTKVLGVQRFATGVSITTERFGTQSFDAVVIATHSDQALNLLGDASAAERSILGAIPYQDNEVILHTDASILPKRRRAWASWNSHINTGEQARSVVTYNMNRLQGLEAPVIFCVTLNDAAAIAEEKILCRFNYAHPVFTLDGIKAQERWSEINGVNRTWFCGAYWRNGFHEDGVVSALRVCEKLGVPF